MHNATQSNTTITTHCTTSTELLLSGTDDSSVTRRTSFKLQQCCHYFVSNPCISFMIGIISLVGMLEYIFPMSNEANFIPGLYGILSNSFMSCVGLVTLKALGRGVCNWISLLRNFAILYAGASRQFTMGRIGFLILCILGRPRIFGGVGFMFVSLNLESPGNNMGQFLIVSFILFWNVWLGSLLRIVKLLLSMKSWTFVL